MRARFQVTRRVLAGSVIASATLTSMACRLPEQSRLTGERWSVFYGQTLDAASVFGLDVIVLDPAVETDINALKSAGVQVLGYISLGELDTRVHPRSAFLDEALFLRENENWQGAVAIDVRRPAWRDFILDNLASAQIEQGFDGFFLDTLDTPPHLESLDPVRYAGMRAAAIDLVSAMRQKFPDAAIMMNRGYALLPDVVGDIDAVLAESLLTQFDFESRTYRWVDDRTRGFHMKALEAAKGLPIYSLDYWRPDDPGMIKQIYDLERAIGHRPYVSVVQLDQIVAEPGEQS
jgi:uncharacterized protein (TIGR01370 family)